MNRCLCLMLLVLCMACMATANDEPTPSGVVGAPAAKDGAASPAACGLDDSALSDAIQQFEGENLAGPLCDDDQPPGAQILCANPLYLRAHRAILTLNYYAEMNATKQFPRGYDTPRPWQSDCLDAQCVCQQLTEEIANACMIAGCVSDLCCNQ